MAADSVASLFDWSDSTKPDGMGIGLSICRTIIAAHDGTIWLEKSGSTGSCFCFSLPLRVGTNQISFRLRSDIVSARMICLLLQSALLIYTDSSLANI